MIDTAQRSAGLPIALAKGKRSTRDSELLLPRKTIEHQDRTRLYSESSSGSEYEYSERASSEREDLFLGSSPEPSKSSTAKKRTQMKGHNKRLRVLTPDSTSASRILPPSQRSESPYPMIESRSKAGLGTIKVESRATSTVATNAESSSKFPTSRKRPRVTVEIQSKSHRSASDDDRASSARSQRNATLPESPEIPVYSPGNGREPKEEAAAESDSESVMFCGSGEMRAKSEASDSKLEISRSRDAAATKQKLAVSLDPGASVEAS